METAHLASLFEHSTEGIILTDEQGLIVLVNPAAERMFGYAASDMTGHPVERLIPDRVQHLHSGLRHHFYERPQNRSMGTGRDLYAKRQDGTEFPVEVSLSFYEKDHQLFVIAFIVDITPRKKIEAAMILQQQELASMALTLKELNTGLEQKVEERTLVLQEALEKLEISQLELHAALQKEKELNEVKSRFMSIASHEFRTPLSTVLSSASLLSRYSAGEEQPKRERHVEKIKNAVHSLNGILEDFLSLGKLEEGKIAIHTAPFDVRELMSGILEEMTALLKPGQQFSLECSGISSVSADKRLVKNILINLLTNAIKFSGEGGNILLTVLANEKQLTIQVADQGIGIPEPDKKELFSSFHRAGNAVNIEGTGLGLHIVKRYLELLHGSIDVRSELGAGSTFTIILPVTTD